MSGSFMSRSMTRLTQWWNRTWFGYTDRYQYGLFRIILVGGLFGVRGVGEWSLDAFHRLIWASSALTAPVPLLRLLHLPVPPPLTWFAPVEWTFRVAMVAAFFGIGTRPALIVLATLNLYIQGTLNSFGFIDHATTIPSIVLAILAIAPGATRYSVDAWIKRWWITRRAHRNLSTDFGTGGMNAAPTTASADRVPVWPAHLVVLVMGLAYFSSGYSKMVKSSGAWIDGWTLTSYLLDAPNAQLLMAPTPARARLEHARLIAGRPGVSLESFVYDTGYPTGLGRLVTRYHPVIVILSCLTVLWELTFILTMFFPRLLPYYLVAGVGFHGGIMMTLMLYSFYSFLVCYLLFVDWNAGWRLVRRPFGQVAG